MRLEPYNWNHHQPITNDYLHHFDRLKDVYETNPWETDALNQRLNWLDTNNHFRANRSELIEALQAYNDQIGNSSVAFEAIEALRDNQTLCVVGGQQAGLFLGPLLVVYKAITLIQAAEKASKRLDRKVVPIFWIAGEDHDFDEVNHTYTSSRNAEIEKIKLEHSSEVKASISHLSIDMSQWEQAIVQLKESIFETEYTVDLLAKLESIAKASPNMADFFARILIWLLGDHGLIILDSADSRLRRVEAPMFQQLIEQYKEINMSIIDGKNKVSALGYEPQANVQEGQVNLFIIHEGERRLLHEHEGGFSDKKNELHYSKEDLLHIAATTPERLSNNVFTRPLMQEFLFPVIQTVLGPGEIAYWGLIGGAFRSLDMRMPILTPRREFTLIEGTIQKHMQKYELTFDDVIHRFDERRATWLDAQDNLQIEQKFTDAKKQFDELYNPLLEMVSGIHAGMGKLGETNKQKIVEQINFLQTRSLDAFQSQYESSLRQLDRIHSSIMPLGKPQERMYNIFMYLNKYGKGWLDEIIQSPSEEADLHTIIYF